jgi:hypothetical protein
VNHFYEQMSAGGLMMPVIALNGLVMFWTTGLRFWQPRRLLWRNMAGLCVRISPLLGLLGTLTGMMHLFDRFAISGEPASLVSGMSGVVLPVLCALLLAIVGRVLLNRVERWHMYNEDRRL